MLHVFKHELRLIFREPRFWIPFIIPPMILAASQAIAVSRYGGEIMQGMESYMMLLLGCLMAPMGAPLAGDSFAACETLLGQTSCDSSVPGFVCTFGAVGLLVFAFRDYNAGGWSLYAWCAFGSTPYDCFFIDDFSPRQNRPCGDPHYIVLYSAASFACANGA